MVIMAGMLPGVECARRRRMRQPSSGAAEARRASLCLYAGGRGRDLDSSAAAASASSSKVWSGACGETMTTTAMASAWTMTLGNDAREAKERLDHKLRGQRLPVVLLNRYQMSTRPPPAKPHDDAARGGGGDSDGHHRHHHSATAAAPCGVLLQREVVLPSSPSRPAKKGGGCRFGWCRRLSGGRCGPPPAAAEAEAECAVCLEELRAGDVVARLPCAHRFHWSCAVPWVQAVSRCPVCRAHVHVAVGPSC